MTRSTFIRIVFMLLIAISSLFLLATTHHSYDTLKTEESSETNDEKSKANENRGEFIVWETMGQTVFFQ